MKVLRLGLMPAALASMQVLTACSDNMAFKGTNTLQKALVSCSSETVPCTATPLPPPVLTPSPSPSPTATPAPTPIATPIATPVPTPVPPVPTPIPPQLGQDVYQVPTGNAKADVVFILDTTNTMFKTIQELPTRLGEVLSSWSNIDWQAGVMNADPIIGNFRASAGKLITINSYPASIETPQLLMKSNPYADYMLDQTVNFDGLGWPGNKFCDKAPFCQWSSSQPMAQIVQLINQRADPANAGFFRPGAYLVPIIVSAQDETSSVSAADVMNAYQSALGNSMAGLRVFSMTVKPGDAACLSQYQSIFSEGTGGAYGSTIGSLTAASGGASMSVCSADYQAQLSRVITSLAPQVKSIALSHVPTADSLKISFSQPYPGTWMVSGSTVQFSQPLPVGAKITLTYSY